MSRQQLHVIFGSGPLGKAVARELLTRKQAIRLINRSGRAEVPNNVEVTAADAADPATATRAAAGAAIIYHCAQPPYVQWPSQAADLTKGILGAAEATGARLVYGDNLYMYGPVSAPLVESLPNRPVGPNGRTRAELATELLAAHRTGRAQVTIARASDFFGPFATNSIVGEQVFGRALQGKPAQVLGNPETPHSYTFIEDFARAMIILGERDEALGEAWHVPSGEALTTREFIGLVYREVGREPRLSTAPSWAIRLLGLVNPTMRAVSEVLYQSDGPWVLDSAKFSQAFGDITTPKNEAIARTLAWYRTHRSSQGRDSRQRAGGE